MKKEISYMVKYHLIEGEEPLILLPKVKITYFKRHEDKKGDIRITQEENHSSWKIDYELRCFLYSLQIKKSIFRSIYLFSEGSMHSIIEAKGGWLIKDHGTGFKIITHPIEEAENAEKLIGTKIVKQIEKPKLKIEYYEKDKILKIPFFKSKIRINVENENLEYIRNNKKIIKAYPLNKEIHFYGIEPKIKYID
jgi:hypothetical protein